jgi:hypothetical protein
MYTRDELKEIRSEFWTNFGKIMKPHRSQTGEHIRWTNYRTGVKDMYFRLNIDHHRATLSIDLQHPDLGIRDLFWEQLFEFKSLLSSHINSELYWHYSYTLKEGQNISHVVCYLEGVSLNDKNTWPNAFAFLKSNILNLDAFWADARDIFIHLQE